MINCKRPLYFLIVSFLFFFSFKTEGNTLIFKKIFVESIEDPKYSFGKPSQPRFDTKNNMYVYDSSNGLVYKYDYKLNFITRIGKGLGQGPGEVPSFGVGFYLTNSSIFLYDYRGKLNSYSLSGEYRWTRDMKFKEAYFLIISNLFTDSSGYATKCPEENFNLRQMILFSKYGLNTKEIGHLDLSRYAKNEYMPALSYLPMFISTNDENGNVYYAINQEFMIYKANWNNTAQFIKEKYTPFSASKEFKQKALKEMKIRYRGGKYLFEVMDTFPVVRGLQIDNDGNIWVLSYTKERNGFIKYNCQGKLVKFYNYKGINIGNNYKNVSFYIINHNVYVSQYDNELGLVIFGATFLEK